MNIDTGQFAAIRDRADAADALAVVRAAPGPGEAMIAAVESLAESIESASFALTDAAAARAGHDAEAFADGFLAGRSSRPRVPRPRGDRSRLRVVGNEGHLRDDAALVAAMRQPWEFPAARHAAARRAVPRRDRHGLRIVGGREVAR